MQKKNSFFHKPSKTGEIHLRPPKLTINDNLIERRKFTEFLWVLLDEQNCKRSRVALQGKTLSFLHTCINNVNIA